MITTNKRQVADLVEICVQKGVEEVIVCPGSRDAPFIIAFGKHAEINTTHIVDERSAAFYALGLALKTEKLVAIVCSSGSAVLNFAPAVAEAFHQGIPLLILTADRPKQWIGQMVGQTINQTEILKNVVKDSFTLEQGYSSELEVYYNQRTSNQAINLALDGKKGPVHVNVPLLEPLYDQEEYSPNVKLINSHSPSNSKDTWLSELSDRFNQADKVLVLVGQNCPNPILQKELDELSKRSNVVVMLENLSNIQLPFGLHCIDRSIASMESSIEHYTPDLLISIGGAVVSKRIKALLRSMDIKEHWRIQDDSNTVDTYQNLTEIIRMKPEHFLQSISTLENTKTNYRNIWKKDDFINHDNQPSQLSELPFCDLKAFEKLNDYLPENTVVHLGNSSVVRYSQLFNPVKGCTYQGNRGVSGIDGSLSTAIGYAKKSEDLNVLILGDLSFMYDSNAFWIEELPKNLKVIVINNGGGGIFKIIPGPDSTSELNKGFVTEHSRTFNKFIDSYDVSYSKVNTIETLESELQNILYQSDDFSVLEIDTRGIENEKFLKQYFNSLSK